MAGCRAVVPGVGAVGAAFLARARHHDLPHRRTILTGESESGPTEQQMAAFMERLRETASLSWSSQQDLLAEFRHIPSTETR